MQEDGKGEQKNAGIKRNISEVDNAAIGGERESPNIE